MQMQLTEIQFPTNAPRLGTPSSTQSTIPMTPHFLAKQFHMPATQFVPPILRPQEILTKPAPLELQGLATEQRSCAQIDVRMHAVPKT